MTIMILFFRVGFCQIPNALQVNPMDVAGLSSIVGPMIGGLLEPESRLTQINNFALPGTIAACWNLLKARGLALNIPHLDVLCLMFSMGIIAYCFEHRKNLLNKQSQ